MKVLALLALSLSVVGAISLPDAVTVDGIFNHLSKLEEIAKIDGLNSRSVRNNYNASAEYVRETLSPYCQTTIQHFVVPVHQELKTPSLELESPYQTQFQHAVDFQGMRYGGSGTHNFTAKVVRVIDGCTTASFSGFPRGAIALIQEGNCDLVQKAFLAEDFGASGVLFFNQQTRTTLLTTRVRIVAWKEGDRLVQIPCIALSNVVGKLLSETPGAIVNIQTSMLLTEDSTYNVFCESAVGSKTDIVMAGAHLDSVPEGPGLNDNGSGSATLLEIALQFFKTGVQNKNAVRFAWWGAEEIGLLGSRHYVRDLQENNVQGLKNIALYMNFDMLGSPNFIPYIHDGYKVGNTIPEEVKRASRQVQLRFEDYYIQNNLPYQTNDMTGGSDFLPFIEAGVATSGQATGASGIKNADEREEFSGLANAAYDPCYHLYCDTVPNVSKEAVRQISQATATVIEEFSTMADLRGYLGIS